jgi:DNA replication protein DnaC
MLTGINLMNTLVDELNDLGLPNMAATLDILYHSEKFLNMDHLTLISELIEPEYRDKISKRINNRLRSSRLIGSPQELSKCIDSKDREYLPSGITEVLSSMDFIVSGLNICILGSSDSGKTYLAKALGIRACDNYRVQYHHCETFLEEMVALKLSDYQKYQRKVKKQLNLDLLILDDFLLHTITDEREIKVLFEVLEKRSELSKSTVICSQREPKSWASMIMNDEVSSNAIMKRATKHYTIVINTKVTG